MRKTGFYSLFLIVAMLATSVAGAASQLVIGSTNFTEQLILANIYSDVLKARGVDVKKRLNLGSREVVYPSLKSGELDVLPEYTGALLNYLTDGQNKATSQKKVEAKLKKALPKQLTMLQPSAAQDKDALVVTQETAKKYNLKTVSDLKGPASELIIGGPPEMKTRAIGLPGYKKVYGLDFETFRSLDAGGPLTTGALDNGDIDVARMFTTQGIIDKRGWVVLKDDKNMVPAQNLVPIIRKDTVTPTIRKGLNAIATKLTTKSLQHMNRQVSVERKSPSTVAQNWVKQHGLGG